MENHSAGQVRIYPNPARETVNIELTGPRVKAQVEIFDIGGRQLRSISYTGSISIPISDLSGGIYIYRISAEGQQARGKIIVE